MKFLGVAIALVCALASNNVIALPTDRENQKPSNIRRLQIANNPLADNNKNPKFFKRDKIWDYQGSKVRGVNLGGWFVLEPFITPSLFEVFDKTPVDEYHYCQSLGKTVCSGRLQTHWDTWYTEQDFQEIKSLGLNMVRIPIGYWAFTLLDNDPYVQGQTKYLDRAISWCRKYGLKVWVDLHGAPGSQNGFDNSGLRDSYKFQDGDNVQITLDVLKKIGDKYGSSDYDDVVIGIELLNEPLGPILNMDQLKDFYTQGYNNLRWTGSSQFVVIQDAFQEMGYWDDFMTVQSGDYWNVVVDHHHYQVFAAAELQRSIDEHISVACSWGSDAKKEYHWSISGEWSAALTDCAKWLNGVGKGARYSGDLDNSPYIDSCDNYIEVSSWSDEYRTNVRKYIEAQLDAFEQNGGWIFWNWKCEDAIEWDFKRLTAAGVFPSPLSERTYPNQCNF
ncbi:uncharacterized protein PRCAT00003788001 [Priceomyces carsonii]|uniref:uncharacterized protein n=1 Tax=Priceomyces carsonii TaxID=28549 RepID=UPI002ED9902B|nr:unnamed protein product [Priceomyces carsonii]